MPVYKVGKNSHAFIKKVYKAFSTRAEAKRFEAQHAAAWAKLEQHGHADVKCCTIRDHIEDFLDDRVEGEGRRACNEHTAELHRRRLLMFDRVFHSKPLNCITAAEVKAWKKRRRRTKYRGKLISRDTVNLYLGTLKAYARWAQGKELAPDGLPLLTVPKSYEPGKLTGMNRKPPIIMDIDPALDLVERIRAERPDIGLFLDAMILFIRRPAAVAGLRRRDLRLPVGEQPGSLNFRAMKGYPAITIPIPAGGEAHAWALRCVEMVEAAGVGRDGPLLICIGGRSRKNPGGWTTGSLDMAIGRLCEGWEDLPAGWRPYVLRHTLISWLQDQVGMTIATVQAGASHTTPTTQAPYSHRKARQAWPAFAAVEAFLQRRKKHIA